MTSTLFRKNIKASDKSIMSRFRFPWKIWISVLVACSAVSFSGCKSVDSALNNSGKLLNVAMSSTGRDIAKIAKSSRPTEALAKVARNRGASYRNDPRRALYDIKTMRSQFNQVMSGLTGLAGKQWGRGNTRVPDRTHYVKYTHNYKSRAVVDFDRGWVTVETLEEANSAESLKSAIVTTLLTPDDPRAVDLFSDADIKLTSQSTPYLYGLLLDQDGKPIADPKGAERFAAWQIEQALKTKTIKTETGDKRVHFVKMAMVSNFEDKQAKKYQPAVQRFARKFGISESLVFGVIRAESNFNPFAVSPAPAFGLMQLVPSSGGREGYKKARGKDRPPSRNFLFDAENNIELGTAYLGVLFSKQMSGVYNDISREYCVIAAYNTGPSNVLKAFSRSRQDAFDRINRIQPPQVYDRLVHNLPYAETRSYVQKVVKYRRNYVSL